MHCTATPSRVLVAFRLHARAAGSELEGIPRGQLLKLRPRVTAGTALGGPRLGGVGPCTVPDLLAQIPCLIGPVILLGLVDGRGNGHCPEA
jgi:hypothetical protein